VAPQNLGRLLQLYCGPGLDGVTLLFKINNCFIKRLSYTERLMVLGGDGAAARSKAVIALVLLLSSSSSRLKQRLILLCNLFVHPNISRKQTKRHTHSNQFKNVQVQYAYSDWFYADSCVSAFAISVGERTLSLVCFGYLDDSSFKLLVSHGHWHSSWQW
jgi:hypothetical protein